MPLYDLQCLNKECALSTEPHEVFCSFSELEKVRCAKCGSEVKQIIQGACVHIAAHHKADYGAGK